MPQHVGMDAERHFGGGAKPGQHPAKGNCGHWSAALAHEDISSGFLFSLETAQGAKFGAGQWVDQSADGGVAFRKILKTDGPVLPIQIERHWRRGLV